MYHSEGAELSVVNLMKGVVSLLQHQPKSVIRDGEVRGERNSLGDSS